MPIENHEIVKVMAFKQAPSLSPSLESQNSGDNPLPPGTDPLVAAFFYLFECVNIQRKVAQTQSQELEVNTMEQNKVISLENQQNFHTLSPEELSKKDPTDLADFEAKNQEVSAIREVFQNELTTDQQGVEIIDAHLNTTSDEIQQSLQEGGSLMQMLQGLTNQISKI